MERSSLNLRMNSLNSIFKFLGFALGMVLAESEDFMKTAKNFDIPDQVRNRRTLLASME